ncbi:MAG: hypothetical protein AUJ55_06610 [Proteobacteria bacterium CG1_02_64_396]|nr:MAG: hypothetical protein AUJ55_06610 [Proteobacteria bacterium CG1_02_64_396]
MQLALKITASGGQAKAEILGLSQTVGDLGETSLRSTQQMAAGVTAARRGITSISTQLAQARTLWLSFQALPFASGGLSGIVAVADTWTNLDGRIRLATGSMAASRVAMRDLYAVAQETRTPIAANADLFSRLALSTRQLGVSQAELIEITKTLSQASVVSGASSSSASAAMTQLAQGFASGTLRGDELNSVLEQTPRIAQAIADGLGVPLGALRALGEQGQITAATVIEALRSQAATVQAEFDQMPVTIEQASTRIANAFGRWLNAQNKISGATTDLATALDGVANHMAALASGGIALAEAALAIWLARQTSAVAIAAQAALAARAQKAALLEQTQAELASAEAALAKARADSIMGAVAQQTVADLTAQTAALRSQVADLTGATKAAGIGIAGLFNLLGAGMAGYAIGSWAREEFAVVRQAGDALVLALLKGWEWIKFGAAATWEGIKTGSGEAVGWIGSLFVGLLQVLRNGWQTAQTAATVVWTGAKFAASAAFEGIQTALKGLLTALKTGAESLGLDTVARKIGEWESAIQPAGRALADYRVAMRRVADEATAGYGAIQEGSDRLRAGLDRAKGGVTSLSDSLSKLAQERDRALGGIDAVGVEMFAAPNDVGAPTAPSPRSIPAPRIDPTQAQQAVEQARQLTADLLGTAQDASTKMASEYSARWEALVAVEGAGSARVVALEQAYGQWLAQQERERAKSQAQVWSEALSGSLSAVEQIKGRLGALSQVVVRVRAETASLDEVGTLLDGIGDKSVTVRATSDAAGLDDLVAQLAALPEEQRLRIVAEMPDLAVFLSDYRIKSVEQARQLTADLLGTAQDASTKMASEYSARWEALVAVEGAGSARVVALEQAYGQWLAQQERDKTDALLAAARDRSTALEQEWQGQFLTEAERENLRYQRQLEALAAERKAVEDSGQMTAALRARYDRDELRAKQIHENAKAGVEKQAAEARLSLTAGVFGALSALLANGGKKAFEASKALAIAETVVSTYAAAQKAYESQLAIPTPDAPARAAVAAGIAVVQGVARVAAISKQQYGGAASASAGGGVGAGVQSTPGSMATGSGYGGVTGAHDKAATPPTQPPVTIHLQVQALHPDEVSAGTLQRIAEALSPVLDRNINRGANVAVSV